MSRYHLIIINPIANVNCHRDYHNNKFLKKGSDFKKKNNIRWEISVLFGDYNNDNDDITVNNNGNDHINDNDKWILTITKLLSRQQSK